MLRTSRIVGAVTAAILAGSVISALPANAAGDPRGWAPDANVAGGLLLFDANGYQITSGSINDSPLAGFYEGSGGALAGGLPTNKASIFYSTPVQGANSATWAGTQQVTASQTQPLATLPGDLSGTTNFVVKGNASDGSLNTIQITAFPNGSAVAGYAGLYEIRMHSGGANLSNQWYSAVVSVSSTTWTQVWPVLTATSVNNVPTSATVASGAAVDLTATATTGIAGTVIFKEGSTIVSGPTAVDTTTGQAAAHITGVADGTHHYTAYFYPTPNFASPAAPSVSTPATVTVGAVPADNTATALTVVPGAGVATSNQTIKAVVTDSTTPATTPVGTVAFYDNGSTTALTGTVVQGPSGTFTLTRTLGVGAHSIVAKFTPTNTALFNASQSAAKAFSLYGLPGLATGIGGIPGAKVITVVWRAAPNNGAPINGYQVVAYPKVGAVQVGCSTAGTLACVVRGLVNGVGYRFAVRAHNAAGWGAWSAYSLPAVAPGVPSAPRALVATYPAAKQTRVTWALPLYNGGYALNLYQVSWSANGITWTAWTNTTVRTALHVGTLKGKPGWFRVRAHNVAGFFGAIAVVKYVQAK